MAGWGGAFARGYRSRGRILTFALGAGVALETRPLPRQAAAIPFESTSDEMARGARLFATYCGRCHGGATILPDLRTSPPGVYAIYENILLEGSLAERGMPAFAHLTPADVNALKAFVLDGRRKLAALR
jgi:mono/diheme cytochrome c family protein